MKRTTRKNWRWSEIGVTKSDLKRYNSNFGFSYQNQKRLRRLFRVRETLRDKNRFANGQILKKSIHIYSSIHLSEYSTTLVIII